MGPYFLFNVMGAGACVFGGLYYGWLWRQSHRERALLHFSLVCLASALQLVTIAQLSSAPSVADYQRFLDLRTTTGIGTLMFMTWTIAWVTGMHARRYVRIITVVCCAVLISNIFFVRINGTVSGIERLALPWGELVSTAVRTESAPWWLRPIYVTILSIGFYTIIAGWRMMKTDRTGGILVVACGAIFLVTTVAAVLIDLFHLRLPYSGAPAFVAWLALLAFVVAREYGRRDEQIRRAERLAALGTLAGGVAHDLNNALAAIMGNVELINLKPSGPRVVDCVKQIGIACEQMSSLNAALLRFVRQGSNTPEIYDAHDAIRSAALLFKTNAGNARVDLSGLTADWSKALGQQHQLQNAILNLLLNARDAGANRIVIASSVRELDPKTREDLKPYRMQAGRCLVVTVADHGSGMNAETLGKCFLPFFTTKGERGTGLGLASVHAAVMDHHGAVTVQSAVGKGTTFTLYLPLVETIIP
jgi:signal transduction histidine kinase